MEREDREETRANNERDKRPIKRGKRSPFVPNKHEEYCGEKEERSLPHAVQKLPPAWRR